MGYQTFYQTENCIYYYLFLFFKQYITLIDSVVGMTSEYLLKPVYDEYREHFC